jgi:hypothetical protein
MSAETNRTGPLVEALVEGVQADITDIVELLSEALTEMRRLEASSRGINGLAGICKAKGSEIELVIRTLRSESESIPAKLLPQVREPIHEHTNTDHAAKVIAAKGAA